MTSRLKRRDVLIALGGSAGLAGCAQLLEEGSGNTETESGTPTETYEEPSVEEILEIQGAKPELETQFLANSEFEGEIQNLEIDGTEIDGETLHGDGYTEEYHKTQTVNAQATVKRPNGQLQEITGEIDITEWEDRETLYNAIVEHSKIPERRGGKDREQLLEEDTIEEIRQKENIGEAMEQIHVILSDKYATSTRKEYTNMLRKAANEEVGFNWKEAIVNNIRTVRDEGYGVVHRKNEDGPDFYDTVSPFSGEENYHKEGENFEKGGPKQFMNSLRTTGLNPANVTEIRNTLEENNTEEEDIERLTEKYDKFNDTLFIIPNSGDGEQPEWQGPRSQIGFEHEVGNHLDQLKKDVDFVLSGTKFFYNHIGEDDYMHVDTAETMDELEQQYSNRPLEKLTEHNGQVFAATTVDEQTHLQATKNLYKPENMVES